MVSILESDDDVTDRDVTGRDAAVRSRSRRLVRTLAVAAMVVALAVGPSVAAATRGSGSSLPTPQPTVLPVAPGCSQTDLSADVTLDGLSLYRPVSIPARQHVTIAVMILAAPCTVLGGLRVYARPSAEPGDPGSIANGVMLSSKEGLANGMAFSQPWTTRLLAGTGTLHTFLGWTQPCLNAPEHICWFVAAIGTLRISG